MTMPPDAPDAVVPPGSPAAKAVGALAASAFALGVWRWFGPWLGVPVALLTAVALYYGIRYG